MVAQVPSAQVSQAGLKEKKPLYRELYFQVLAGIFLGAMVGHLFPQFGASLKPLGDGFIKLVKMIIAPVIFLTVATGIAGMRDMNKVGSVAGKANASRAYQSTGRSRTCAGLSCRATIPVLKSDICARQAQFFRTAGARENKVAD